MPEGDTVYRAAAHMRQALRDRVLTRAELRVPRFSAVDLVGRRVEDVRSRGKILVVVVCPDQYGRDPVTLHLHLKMEGRIHVLAAGERWRFPAHTVRLVLGVGDSGADGPGAGGSGGHSGGGAVEVVGTDLGYLRALTPGEVEVALAELGPDLLGDDWARDPRAATDEAVRRLAARPTRTIGEALLDQRNLAGIGTIYRAELCFLRGIDPRDPVAAVPDLPGVVTLARRLLLANADRAVRVTTGHARRGRELWVYGRDGQPCRRCGTLVQTYRLGGRGAGDLASPGGPARTGEPVDSLDRIAFSCPSCQPRRSGPAVPR